MGAPEGVRKGPDEDGEALAQGRLDRDPLRRAESGMRAWQREEPRHERKLLCQEAPKRPPDTGEGVEKVPREEEKTEA